MSRTPAVRNRKTLKSTEVKMPAEKTDALSTVSKSELTTSRGDDTGREKQSSQPSKCLTVLGLHSSFESLRQFPDLKGSNVNKKTLGEFKRAVDDGVLQFVAHMSPRDDLERMTLEQLVFQHLRALNLGRLASSQSGLEAIQVLNRACDGASDAYRKLLMALAAYRALKKQ
jgi:hypothetical protein